MLAPVLVLVASVLASPSLLAPVVGVPALVLALVPEEVGAASEVPPPLLASLPAGPAVSVASPEEEVEEVDAADAALPAAGPPR